MKVKHPIILLVWFATGSLLYPALGQSTLIPDTVFNQTDRNGRKQGYWKKTDPKGNLIYQGYFLDGTPRGKFIRYYENGNVKSKMNYLPDGHSVDVDFYYTNGKPAAEGHYYDKKKDGEWKYYSFYEDFLSYKEKYVHGKKEGESVKYYPDGTIAEKLNWKNGSRNGIWVQYYPNGKQKLDATYVNDTLTGPLIIYQLSGEKQIEGMYKNNLREGEWHFYDLNGKLSHTYHYLDGICAEENDIVRRQTEILDSLEKQKGNFSEPNLNNLDFNK